MSIFLPLTSATEAPVNDGHDEEMNAKELDLFAKELGVLSHGWDRPESPFGRGNGQTGEIDLRALHHKRPYFSLLAGKAILGALSRGRRQNCLQPRH